MKVVYFQRKPRLYGNYSVEIYFESIRKLLPDHIEPVTVISKYESNGFWKRLSDTFRASRLQGDINHVTGDVHFLTLLLNKKRTVLTVLDCGFMNNPSALKRWVLKIFWLTLPVRKAAWITVISEATKTELLRYVNYPLERIKVIPVFISPLFQPSPRVFNKEKPVILQVGTAFNKNLNRLIEALAGIPCQLVVVGKLTQENQELLQKHGIDYKNPSRLTDEQMAEQYINCDILTLISTYEGFGMPILEANAVERVVITSNILSMPEVAGDAACLTDPLDIAAIRNSLLKVINDDDYRNTLIANGRKNKKRFSAQSITNQFVELYGVMSFP
jgi:glycosyltransferase involved in cell wall biosynthesis